MLLARLGKLTWHEGDRAQAIALLQESLALARQDGLKANATFALRHLGSLARATGDLAGARTLLEEGLALEIWGHELWALGELASLAAETGDVARAMALARETLEQFRALAHDRPGRAYGLRLFAVLAVQRGAHARGVFLHGAAEAAHPCVPIALGPAEPATWEASLRAARAALGADAFAEAWAAGQATPLEQAVADVLESQAD